VAGAGGERREERGERREEEKRGEGRRAGVSLLLGTL